MTDVTPDIEDTDEDDEDEEDEECAVPKMLTMEVVKLNTDTSNLLSFYFKT